MVFSDTYEFDKFYFMPNTSTKQAFEYYWRGKYTYPDGQEFRFTWSERPKIIAFCIECNEYFTVLADQHRRGRGCTHCERKEIIKRLAKSFVNKCNNKKDMSGIELPHINTEYNNGEEGSIISVICKKHNESFTCTAKSFIMSSYNMCPKCRAEGMVLKYERLYNDKNGEIFSLINLSKKDFNQIGRSCIRQWVYDSIISCDSKCVISGETERLALHHKYGFNIIMKETLSELKNMESPTIADVKSIIQKKHYKNGLGVVITETLHKKFHSIYGRGNNTPEQFNNFVFNMTKVTTHCG